MACTALYHVVGSCPMYLSCLLLPIRASYYSLEHCLSPIPLLIVHTPNACVCLLLRDSYLNCCSLPGIAVLVSVPIPIAVLVSVPIPIAVLVSDPIPIDPTTAACDRLAAARHIPLRRVPRPR